jgi:spore germination cell wall hydrolase CwlJ-like protein
MAMLSSLVVIGQKPDPKVESLPLPKPIPEEITVTPVAKTAEVKVPHSPEFECLRKNVYFEAGNQDLKGKEVIALVTLTRTKVKHYPSTICGVVKQKAQFSWCWDGKSDKPNLKNVLERKAWDEATRVATLAMAGKIKDFTHGATHYHATYVNPSWATSSRMQRVAQVGTHILYRDVLAKIKA